MKIYLIWGDSSADMQDDIYPSEPVCDDCILELKGKEDSCLIQEISDFDSMYGEECYCCGKSKEEEDEEFRLDAILSNTDFFNTFQKEILNIRKLNEIILDDQDLEKTLNRQLFVGAVTCMETYLCDAFIITTLSQERYLKAFVTTFHGFKEEKFQLNQIYDVYQEIEKKVKEAMSDVIYHNLSKVRGMYKDTLGISFPELTDVIKAVRTRHHLVHRNGKTKDGKEVFIDKKVVTHNLDRIESFISQINEKLKTNIETVTIPF